MGLISALLAQLLAAYTVLVEPFLRTNFYRNLKKQLNVDPSARLLFYRTQVLWEWSWMVVLAVIVIPIPEPLKWLGLNPPNQIGWIILAALLLGIFLSTYLLRRSPGAMASMQRSLEASSVLLPSTPAERTWFAIAAVTAGICEELLYRGFLMSYLPSNFSMLAGQIILISIISGIIYGLSRAYQGMRGIATTALTGFSFAIVYFLSHSLIPAMVFHTLAELRTMWLWRPETQEKKKKSK
jgi:membrane protease YdiL (CAAX protease family)